MYFYFTYAMCKMHTILSLMMIVIMTWTTGQSHFDCRQDKFFSFLQSIHT